MTRPTSQREFNPPPPRRPFPWEPDWAPRTLRQRIRDAWRAFFDESNIRDAH